MGNNRHPFPTDFCNLTKYKLLLSWHHSGTKYNKYLELEQSLFYIYKSFSFLLVLQIINKMTQILNAQYVTIH